MAEAEPLIVFTPAVAAVAFWKITE